MMRPSGLLVFACLFPAVACNAAASEADVFKVKREAVFEFAKEPVVTRKGDQVSIAFESKGFCDATVAIESPSSQSGKAPRILRHLASGVLGPKAPPPFQKNSKKQTLVWDGKDDRGTYVDDKDAVVVRVSLGLKPRFERTLFWHPGKKAGSVLTFAPGPKGVAVFFSGRATDHLRLFDRDGQYVRTLYPFPAGKLKEVRGLIRHRFPDGVELPIKPNWQQSSFLMSGSNCTTPTYRNGTYSGYRPRKTELPGSAGYAVAMANEKIALVGRRLSRLAVDGTSGGLNLHGPDVSFQDKTTHFSPDARRGEDVLKRVNAKRIAFSPDGRWLYLTRYNETRPGSFGRVIWRNMVMKIRCDQDDAKPEIFAGTPEPADGDGKFNMPADVACDSQGRVYVADHLNDRVQVFSADGKRVKSIPIKRPAGIDVHHKTGEIFVFSWALPLAGKTGFRGTGPSLPRKGEGETYFRLTKFSPLDEARELASWDLRKLTGLKRTRASNIEIYARVDTWADPVRLWMTAPSWVSPKRSRGLGVRIFEREGDGWTAGRDLLEDAAHAIQRVGPAAFNRQRIYVNPADGMLYLAEPDNSHGCGFEQLLRIDPVTARIRQVELPMSTEDLAFDIQGHAYLRTSDMIVRYRSDNWREVPFDYGEGRKKLGFGDGKRRTRVISGAVFPGNKGFHQGGLHVSPSGHIVITALYDNRLKNQKNDVVVHSKMSGYKPRLYPGRRWGQGSRLGCSMVHIFDRHGKIIHADAVPGLHVHINGTFIDARDDVYLLNASPLVIKGKRHFNDHAGTLMKFSPGKARLLAPGGAPVPLEPKPDRPPDLHLPTTWVEGVHWMYPGVGWGGHNYSSGCSCPNTRFGMDYFGRSFTPEIDRYNVGVVDSNGNLIVRVGQCGNVDDGTPLVKGGRSPTPPNPRSIGGDETAIFFAPYVATHSDRRLFIADPGNARIASVKLGYHTEKKIALKDVPDGE